MVMILSSSFSLMSFYDWVRERALGDIRASFDGGALNVITLLGLPDSRWKLKSFFGRLLDM